MRCKSFLNILLVIILLFSAQARADDDAKRLIGGLAIGVLGHVLSEATKDDEDAQAEDIQWNDTSARTTKLKYRDDIAEAQIKLKQLGYYKGKVDGLKGSGTTEAIKNWQMDQDYEADGELSNEEMIELAEHAHDSLESKKKKEEAEARDDDDEITAYGQLYGLEGYKALYHACVDFKNAGYAQGRSLDGNFGINLSDVAQLTFNQAREMSLCEGNAADEFDDIKRKASHDYANSSTEKVVQMSYNMATSSYSDELSFIDKCNQISRGLRLRFEKYRYAQLNEETCDFE